MVLGRNGDQTRGVLQSFRKEYQIRLSPRSIFQKIDFFVKGPISIQALSRAMNRVAYIWQVQELGVLMSVSYQNKPTEEVSSAKQD